MPLQPVGPWPEQPRGLVPLPERLLRRVVGQERVCRRHLPRHDAPLERTTGVETPHLARKPNYDFEKRRKELDRKAKKDAKREERLQRKQENAENGVEGVDPDLEGIVPGPQNINDIMDQK